MGSLSIWHWIVVIVVILLLFGGRGKISQLMGDFAQGIKAFKKGMSEDEKTTAEEPKNEPKVIEQQPASPATAAQPGPAERKVGSTS